MEISGREARKRVVGRKDFHLCGPDREHILSGLLDDADRRVKKNEEAALRQNERAEKIF